MASLLVVGLVGFLGLMLAEHGNAGASRPATGPPPAISATALNSYVNAIEAVRLPVNQLLEQATCANCRSAAGTLNGHWKGGRTRHKAGYIMTRAPGHPRAGQGSYVFEHILVMEEMLGRYLLPDESVHHRNGVRDDNRPENLELWTRPQPTGIRASDAVRWAREILARYAEGTGTSNNVQGLH